MEAMDADVTTKRSGGLTLDGAVDDPQVALLRAEIPLLGNLTYLNSASCSPAPRQVVDAMANYYASMPVNYRSGETPFEKRVTTSVDDIRASLAASIGARAANLVFTKNTTEGINMVASGLEWKRGDEIVVTLLEHQSNLIPWMRLVKTKGVRLRYAPLEPDGRVSLNALGDLLSERTRLLALHHVSNLLGTIQDVAGAAEAAHAVGAMLLVDAAQSEGRIPVDVGALGCDFLVTCARKGLMGPQGIGFLWGQEALLSELEPLVIGGQAAVAHDETTYRALELPYRHEAGIASTASIVGFGAALDYERTFPVAARAAHVTKLTTWLADALLTVDGLTIHSPLDPDVQGGILSWSVAGQDPGTIADALYERAQIVVAAGTCGSPLATHFLGVEGVVRSSLHCFNSFEDVRLLVETIREIAAGR
jgi:cysteine desulfurase/selenocysteine lyase